MHNMTPRECNCKISLIATRVEQDTYLLVLTNPAERVLVLPGSAR